MPATVTDGPLGIACVFSDGSAATFSLDGLPCPALARDLLDGLADLIHPHGTVDTAGSVTHYVQSVRDMTRKLAARGFTGGAPDLRRPLAAEYWLAATGPREAYTRRMLQAITGRFPHIRRMTGTGWPARAGRSRTSPSPLTSGHSTLPPAGSTLPPAAGRRRTCAGCWPGPGRSRPRSSARCWAAPAARSSSGAGSQAPSGTCSRPRTS